MAAGWKLENFLTIPSEEKKFLWSIINIQVCVASVLLHHEEGMLSTLVRSTRGTMFWADWDRIQQRHSEKIQPEGRF